MTWFAKLFYEAQGRIDEASEIIAELEEELRDDLATGGKIALGGCVVACKDLAYMHGLRGCVNVLKGDTSSGWQEIRDSYEYLACFFRSRLATNFANFTSLDSDVLTELFLASIIFRRKSLAKQVESFLESRFENLANRKQNESDFSELGYAAYASTKGNPQKLTDKNPFSFIVNVRSKSAFADKLFAYSSVRGELVEQTANKYSHLQRFPIALFPIEVLAGLEIHDWNLADVYDKSHRWLATALMSPDKSMQSTDGELLNSVHSYLSQEGTAPLKF